MARKHGFQSLERLEIIDKTLEFPVEKNGTFNCQAMTTSQCPRAWGQIFS